MVIHHPKYGHLSSKRQTPIFQIMVPNGPQDGQTPSPGGSPSKDLSPTKPRKATYHHQDGHPLSQQYGCKTSPGWSVVTHHLKDGQLDLEFDSSAAQLDHSSVIDQSWCRMQVIQIAGVTNVMQIAGVVNCSCCKLQVLQIVCDASCTCCNLYLL